MKKYFTLIILFLILSSPFCFANNNIIIETAVGFGSQHFPFSAKWKWSVEDYGLNYKEISARGTYLYKRYLSLSLTSGWIEDIYLQGLGYSPPPFPLNTNYLRDIYYFTPSAKLTTNALRLSLGWIVYSASTNDIRLSRYDYPFNGGKRITPSIGFELGDKSCYLLANFLNSFPLYSGGGIMEFGLGGTLWRDYKQKVYFHLAPYSYGMGFKSEIKVYKKTGMLFGLSFGLNPDGFRQNSNIEYSMTAGIRRTF